MSDSFYDAVKILRTKSEKDKMKKEKHKLTPFVNTDKKFKKH